MPSNAELTDLLVLLCDGEMGQAEWDRLDGLLLDDPAAQEFYGRFIGLDVDLAWRAAGRIGRLPFEVRGSGLGVRDLGLPPAGAAVELPHQLGESPAPSPESPAPSPESPDPSPESPVPHPEPLIPPIIIDTSSAVRFPLSTIPSSLGGWLFSYAAATVITGMAILGAWVYKVSHDDRLAVAPAAAEIAGG